MGIFLGSIPQILVLQIGVTLNTDKSHYLTINYYHLLGHKEWCETTNLMYVAEHFTVFYSTWGFKWKREFLFGSFNKIFFFLKVQSVETTWLDILTIYSHRNSNRRAVRQFISIIGILKVINYSVKRKSTLCETICCKPIYSFKQWQHVLTSPSFSLWP